VAHRADLIQFIKVLAEVKTTVSNQRVTPSQSGCTPNREENGRGGKTKKKSPQKAGSSCVYRFLERELD